MDFYSPLRYPGGKGKVANYFKQVFKDNLLCDGIYVEPYAGGASVALSLLFNEYASKIIINDIDISIYSFWNSVLTSTEEFCKLVRDTPINVETWRLQKQVQKERHEFSEIEIGFSTFFLNRTNRSGILKAGIIGGLEQKGEWKIDARFNKIDLIKRIERIALYKDKIDLYNIDAVDLINNLKDNLPYKSLIYFDPPYYVKGKDLYLNYFNDSDHNKISEAISRIDKQKWIITYDDVPQIQNLYKQYRSKSFKLNYSAGKVARKGDEIIIYSDNLYIPEEIAISK